MNSNLLTKPEPIVETPIGFDIRDHLAVDRTVLANERTLLAYVRTALGFVVLGLTFLHFFEESGSRITAWTLLGVGGVVLLTGVIRFVRMKRELVFECVQNRTVSELEGKQ